MIEQENMVPVEWTQATKPSIQNRGLAKAYVVVTQVSLIVLVILAWQWLVASGVINGKLLGSPVGIWHAGVTMVRDGTLLTDVGITMQETLEGFLLGTVIGTVLGLVLWFSPFAARVFEPFLVSFNGFPKIALGPMIIIWFGSGLLSKVALAFSSTVVVALLSSYQGTKEIDPDFQRLLASLGASRWHVFKILMLPGVMPWILSAMRINIGFALVGAVVGEFISASAGVGYAISVAGNLFDLNTVWVGILLLTMMAGMFYFAISVLEKILLRGRPQNIA